MTSRAKLTAGIAISAALFLGACADEGEDTTAPENDTVAPAPQETATNGAAEDDATTDDTTDPAEDDATAEDDQAGVEAEGDAVFGAIDAVLTEYPEGIIIHIDRADDAEAYEIDVVVNEEVVQVAVENDGNVREDERETEDDDVIDAQAATVTAEEAIQEALDQNPDGILEQAELTEEDGTLQWEIDLDDIDGEDLAEAVIPAT